MASIQLKLVAILLVSVTLVFDDTLAKVRRSGWKRKAKMAVAMTRLSESMSEFSWDMCKSLCADKRDNFVFSPLSVYTAMSMVMLGASGRTKRELTAGLHVSRAVHVGIKAYSDTLNLTKDNEAILNMANAMYTKPGFTWKSKYIKKLTKWYGSRLHEFENENPELAINKWVEGETQEEIVDFLKKGTITADTVMMLINAIYFKGQWKEKFKPENTRRAPFHVSSSERYDVDMMYQNGRFKLQNPDGLKAQVIELPYTGDRFSFYVLLPNYDSNLDSLQSSLDAQTLEGILSSKTEVTYEIDLHFPKFSLDASQEMTKILQKMGINRVFTDKCRLKKMTDARNLYVSSVNHQAIIEVDEEGTTAAAATGVGISVTSLPPQVRVDRPFLFILRDKAQNMNLFMGRFVSPNGENIANSP